MKRTLITLVAAMFVAASANAASWTIDSDSSSYLVGDTITITVTVNVGSEVVGAFGGYGLQAGWDSGIASGPSNSSQSLVLAGLSGSLTPTCAVSGDACTIITQTNSSFANVAVGPAVITGTLQLTATAVGSLALAVNSFQDTVSGGAPVIGSNFSSAEVVPEPTTAALLGLGLLGLGVAGRRR